MIRCFAIDDEPLALRQLATYISKVPFLELAGQFLSAAEARQALDEEQPDALFIDINMPDLNGLDFVRSLVIAPLVVFTTAYSDYAIEGYKVDAVDYLLKPFSLEDFQRAALKVKAQHELRQMPKSTVSSVNSDDVLFVKAEHRIINLPIADIVYIEGMSEYLRIHLAGSEKPIVVLLSMKKLEERLPAYFMRIHRSYIINLKKIKEVGKGRVIMNVPAGNASSEDLYLPIGDLYRDAFNEYLNKRVLIK